VAGIATIVFVETGLLLGFFLPGDSLLVTAGIVVASTANDPDPARRINIWVMLVVTSLAAIIGDAVGFHIGAKLGPALFKKDDSLIFKRKHIQRAHAFYERYGGKTIVIARFVPIVRTFAPFVAGIGRMQYRRFGLFNVAGGIAWVTLFVSAGYGFGNIPAVKRNFQYVILAIIVVSMLPIAIEWWRARSAKSAA